MSAAAVTVEEGGLSELEAVMRVMEDSFDPAFGEAWTAPQCAGLLPLPGVWLSLAREEGEVVGFALARAVAGEAELLLLAVARSAQGRGVGGRLVRRFVEVARARGAAGLHLEVRDGNPAIALYRDFGFREVGRRRNYYHGRDGQLYDAITLGRPVRN